VSTAAAAGTTRDFCLPDLGEGLTDAEVVTWLVSVGDTVAVDQPVVEVETAKAAVEVPTPFAGTVTTLHAAAGDRVSVGAPLISVAAAETSGNVLVGYGTGAAPPRRRRTSPSLREPEIVTADQPADQPADPPADAQTNPPVISPLVRKLARDHHVDLRSVRPTGAQTTITRSDVEAVIGGQPAGGQRRIPLRGARALAAEKLSTSRREIPEATVWVDVDATEFVAARRTLDVSVVALLARFCVLGLRKFPELNARVEPDAVVLLDAIHLGAAAQTPQGLVVPVVRNAHTLTTRDLAAAIGRLVESARAGTVAPGDLTGGTFTVNNYGGFGVDGSAAIINHPEVAILGIGRIMDRPWVVDGRLAIRKVTQLTLAFDHRACDGAVAGGFLRFVADCAERPITALGEL
jgi:2-oxoisovalerate dehydrogenase E2 component (dihydrolipoyl transacylase)